MATYKLSINSKGISYKGSDGGTSPLDLTVSAPITATYKEQSMNFSLYGVSFHRKMYEPSHIQAEILIELDLKSETGTDGNRYAPAPPTLDFLSTMLMHRPVILYVDSTKVAENFYIHEIAPQYYISAEQKHAEYDNDGNEIKSKTYYYYTYSIYTKLDIFSMDKMFTLNKYSRAYLGKKLFGEIITGQLSDMPAVFSYKAGANEITEKLVLTIATAAKRALQHLGYKSGDNTEEMICPYLVQYNESPYDFFTRVANRFGEPLYFEEGNLCYGLPASGGTSSITNAQSVVFQRISQPPYKVSDKARDDVKEWREVPYMDSNGILKKKGTYELKEDKFLSDDIEYPSGGYPSDAFAFLGDEELKEGRYPYFYNLEYSADDQYQLLYKDKISRCDEDLVKWWGGEGMSAFFPVLADVLNSTSLLDLLSNFLSSMTTRGIQAGIRGSQRRTFWNAIYEKYRKNSTDKYAVLFANVDNDRGHWCTFNYYWDIKQKADELKRRMVCVDMGPSNTSFVKIGDKITLPYDKSTYVVVQIDMCNSTACQKSYFGFDDDTLLAPGKQQQRIYAIPLGEDGLFYPPLLSDKPFPKSGPQPAFVVDNNDPLFQGRVRVSFTWQPSYDSIVKVIESLDSTINTWATNRDSAIALLKKYATVTVDSTTGRATNYVKLEAASDADYNNAVNEYLAVVDKYDTAVAVKPTAEARRDACKNEDSSTPWIRVATPMASPGGGIFFRPEIGDEVMVDFENGNMERPYVVGSLYSKNNTQPWQGERVIVSKNGHTIRFTDPNNSNVLGSGLYPGMKYLSSIGAVGKQLPKIEENPLPCMGGIELTDTWGLYDIKMSSHDRNITISSPFGDVKMSALTGISISAPNGNIKISGKNVEIHASNRLSVTSGENIKNGGYWEASGKSVGKAIGNVITGITGLDKWLDFSILRTLLEIVIRPVDGTLELKSYRYLLMEAGGGEAYIKPGFYKKDKYDQTARALGFSELKLFMDIFVQIGERIDSFVQNFIIKYNAAANALAAFADNNDITPGNGPANQAAKIQTPACKDTLVSDIISKTDHADVVSYVSGMAFHPSVQTDANYKKGIESKCIALFDAINAVKDFAASYSSLLSGMDTAYLNVSKYQKFGAIWGAMGATEESSLSYAPNSTPYIVNDLVTGGVPVPNQFGHDITNLNTDHFNAPKAANTYDTVACQIKRKIACGIIENSIVHPELLNSVTITKGPKKSNHPYLNDNDWTEYINSLTFTKKGDAGLNALAASTLGTILGDNPANMEKNIWSFEGDIWDQSAVGEILFANNDAKTYHFIPDNSNVEGYESPDNGNDINAYQERFKRLIRY